MWAAERVKLPPAMYRFEFRKDGIQGRVLSRELEDDRRVHFPAAEARRLAKTR